MKTPSIPACPSAMSVAHLPFSPLSSGRGAVTWGLVRPPVLAPLLLQILTVQGSDLSYLVTL